MENNLQWKFEKIKRIMPTSLSPCKPQAKNISFQVKTIGRRLMTLARFPMMRKAVNQSRGHQSFKIFIKTASKYTENRKQSAQIGMDIASILHQCLSTLKNWPKGISSSTNKNPFNFHLKQENANSIPVLNQETCTRPTR